MSSRLPLVLSTLAWIVQILAPAAHPSHTHTDQRADTDCHECEERPAELSLDSAYSPGGLDKPASHQHHDRDDQHDAQCLVCKNLLSRLAWESTTHGLSLPRGIVSRTRRAIQVIGAPEQLAHPARGPPSEVV